MFHSNIILWAPFLLQPQSAGSTFPEACTDLGIKHMECLINKRDQAMQVAVKLAGKDKCEKVFPYYEESKKKALDLIQVYKDNLEGGKMKKDVFWG
jgi:DNA-binding sugar fermentation-stimulating protein